MYITSQLVGKGYKDSDYTSRDRHHAVTQTYNNCAETHLNGGVMSPFVSRLSAIARAHDSVV